ncbi:DUF2934 domain-containing protein [Methylomonas sp. AM2-LC]|uniref:DUF2934 domain-containing protein n=1 Tax=Methylomonas sp. AM2-LC TaxID=3153301 RepID=UPI0032663AD8
MKTQEMNIKHTDQNQEHSQPSAQAESFQTDVAEMAYYKAESRGFTPGYELEDWLEAESVFKAY